MNEQLTKAITLRRPTVEDGSTLWQLVKESGTLDLNSAYLYLLLCTHFADTCLIAELNGEAVGFVTAYPPPGRPETLFVWQIGVAERVRGIGLATTLLGELLRRETARGVTHLEATISPSNGASRALFTSLARRLATECTVGRGFGAELFPAGAGHEPEELYRIGPITPSR